MKKYGNPLIILIGGNVLLHLLRTYVHLTLIDEIIAVGSAVVLFAFGYNLNTKSRIIKKTAWFGKLLVFCLFIGLVVYSLGFFDIPIVSAVLEMIGFTRLFLYMMYVYLGFVFGG